MREIVAALLFLTLTVGCVYTPLNTEIPPPQGEVTLAPHRDKGYEISTLLPNGWQSRAQGVVWRKSTLTDLTLIVQQSSPTSAEQLLNSLLPRMQVTRVPEPVGTFQGEALDWTLYRVNMPMMSAQVSVDLALAEQANKSYFVFLQTYPQDRDALYNSVFVPTLTAFAPLALEQTPVPYAVEQVTFQNGDVTLAGTLTLPRTAGPHPAIVLVTGSGRQDRDDAMGGIAMKPFRLIADALTREGIAVLRFDDRGVGGSTGDFATATLADFAADAEAAVAFLSVREDVDRHRVGLLGHSEGGLVAAMLGARNPELDYLIAMAGPGLEGREVLVQQTRRRMEIDGATQQAIDAQVAFVQALAAAADDPAEIERITFQQALDQVNTLPAQERAALGDIEQYARTVAKQTAQEYSAGWFKTFLDYDPSPDWAKTSVPVLALFGGKDVQVDAAQNAPAVQAALEAGGKKNFTIVTLPDANHLFQKAETGSFNEYASLSPEFTPAFIPTILDWLRARGIP